MVFQVVESPCDSALIPDGAALSAFQYFENVRNFLVAVQEMGLPSFEASDLEQVCFYLHGNYATLDLQVSLNFNVVEDHMSAVSYNFILVNVVWLWRWTTMTSKLVFMQLAFCVIIVFIFVQGGKSARVVNSVLALKSYTDWKQTGGNGIWKFGGNVKPTTTSAKSFVRKNSEPFTNSLSRTSSTTEKSLNSLSSDLDSNKMVGKL